jgi:hypothetical protein
MSNRLSLFAAAVLLFAGTLQAATLELAFNTGFGDPGDPDTQAPSGVTPWMTAVFDDGGTAGSVTLTLTVAGTIGGAEVTGVYFNLDTSLDSSLLSIAAGGGTGPTATIVTGSNSSTADGSGDYDILFDLPPPGGDRFGAGETLIYNISGIGSLTASSFNFISENDTTTGPYVAASKFQSTGVDGLQSDWVAANVVPVPAAVWLFGSALAGLGFMRRKKIG